MCCVDPLKPPPVDDSPAADRKPSQPTRPDACGCASGFQRCCVDFGLMCFGDIRRYTIKLSQSTLSKKEAKQARELVDFSINLEAAGDRVVKTMLPLASEKLSKHLRFSDSGQSELSKLHAKVVSNIELALNVLISENIRPRAF